MKVATDLVKFTKNFWYILLSQQHNLPRISMQAATNILVNHTVILQTLIFSPTLRFTKQSYNCNDLQGTDASITVK